MVSKITLVFFVTFKYFLVVRQCIVVNINVIRDPFNESIFYFVDIVLASLVYRYEEGNTTLWKVGLASDFIWSEEPLKFLGSVNALSFDDPACLSIKDHDLTTDEVISLSLIASCYMSWPVLMLCFCLSKDYLFIYLFIHSFIKIPD